MLCPIHISIRQRGHFRTELSVIKGDSTPDPNVSHKSNLGGTGKYSTRLMSVVL